jgi:hypothetical protein
MTAHALLDRDNHYTCAVLEVEYPKQPYASVSLLKVGSTVIPWPKGMSAEDALWEWKRSA